MKILLVGLLLVALVVPSILGVACGPTTAEDQYREAFNSGIGYLKQGKEYLSDAETLVRVGSLDEAALAASRAEGKFRSAAWRFHEAYQIATEHEIGSDIPPTPQQQRATPTGTGESMTLKVLPGLQLKFKVEDVPNSKAWNNWKLSLELEHQSGELVDKIVEAKQEMAQRADVLEFIGWLISVAAALASIL